MSPASADTPPDPEREVRFAVVIYGGASLAIYINGIVQELLRMVRSTALPVEKLTYSERIYRKLACIVGVGESDNPDELDRAITIYPQPAPYPRTKFVADIFSGTSAGGINAIFCAKALATGGSLDELAKLWINVADMDKLLNDKRSIEVPLQLQRPPKSLLNSKWMYLQLLNAFTGMDESAPKDAAPIVSDLDVFLTATDLYGLPLPLALPHQHVMEKRHRNVFHFVRRENGERDDFQRAADFSDSNNPFFAFAARCTSAFPFAFEPMALCDIFPIIQKLDKYSKYPFCKDTTDFWQKFYLDYVGGARAEESEFRYRPFGDGGYLDNKPFSYAIDTVADRGADVPVDRKLIYIEPSPETIVAADPKNANDRPDAIENTLDALIALPRYETIREDLMRLLEWNRNVARLKRVIASLELPDTPEEVQSYRDTLAFRSYQRLRHSATVDAMNLRICKALKIDPDCSHAAALRELIDAWCPSGSSPTDLADFLDSYDFDYMTRAAQYLRGRIRAQKGDMEDARKLSAVKKMILKAKEDRLSALDLKLSSEQAADLASLAEFSERAETTSKGILARRRAFAIQLLANGWTETLDWVDERLKAYLDGILKRAELRELLDKYGGLSLFEVRDSLVFPMIFGTKLGEFGEIDVMRISPQDVTPLVGLTDTKETRGILGQKFGAFGAFLDKRWRKHDILRGRLDGAERLIASILPGTDAAVRTLREQLVIEAQEQIALDWEANYADL